MVDYVVVLRRTIDSLPKNTPDIRERVYARARQTVQSKLEMVSPPPSAGLIQRQMAALEEAIAAVETDYAPALPDLSGQNAPDQHAPAMEPAAEPALAPEPARAPAPAPALAPALAPELALEPRMPPAGMPADIAAPAARVSEAKPAPKREAKAEPAPPAWPEPQAPAPQPSIPQASIPQAAPRAMPPLREPQAYAPPPATLPKQPYEDDFADVFGPDDEAGSTAASLDTPLMPELPRRAPAGPRKSSPWLWPAIGVAVLAIAGAGLWTQRDRLAGLIAAAPPGTGSPATPAPAPAADAPAQPAPAETADDAAPQKFTQRLNADGTEVDAGAGQAAGEASFAPFQPGSTAPDIASGAAPAAVPVPPADGQVPAPDAAATPPATDPAAATTPAPEQAPATEQAGGEGIAIGQKAIFYEERTSGSEGSALPGAVVWSVVRESPGGDKAPEPAVRGELSIPENGLRVRMTLRRNADATLPASHILELVVTVPEGFAGGAIDEVQRVNFKPTEENAGASLVAVPVRIADGFFLVALDQAEAAQGRNLALIAEQNWLDIPVVYRTGRRALFTMEKGLTGQRVFKEVLDAWAAQPL